MVDTRPEYSPPTSEAIKVRQNEDDALRLLIAQRRFYSRAKRWQSTRWVGLLVISLAAPVVTIIWDQAAVWVGACAGLWLFLGRTFFSWRELATMTKGAIVQEDFDLHIFDMPRSIERADRPSLEDIARISGDNSTLQITASREKLLDWYPVTGGNPGTLTVAIAQRANAEYSHRLLRTTVAICLVLTVAWAVILVVISASIGLPLSTFILGVALPVLPAALDVSDYLHNNTKAASDRRDLARMIEQKIRTSEQIEGFELLVWQDRLFDLRRTTPQIPDWLYRITREKNERDMKTAADQLSNHGGSQG
jgi:hypothetical protein